MPSLYVHACFFLPYAPIDVDTRAIDKVRLVRTEVADQTGDVLRLAYAPLRDGDWIHSGDIPQHICIDGTGEDAVDRDVFPYLLPG